MNTLTDILQANHYTAETTQCAGCNNHCAVQLFHFANGKTYASGNNCERVYSNSAENVAKGRNMFAEKYALLFGRTTAKGALKIGIPRALGIYENYPFWHALLTECGVEVVLSSPSTVNTYTCGARTIMADNICFPAKLMHGHVQNLIEKRVDRILYPFVAYEQKDDAKSRNSFNCPIVSAYADVIRASMQPEQRHDIPLDAPVISFKDNKLLYKAVEEYLRRILPSLTTKRVQQAFDVALKAQDDYRTALQQRAQEIYEEAQESGRMTILLAGRPYHTDPLIEHKIAQAIADMGADVITEHIASSDGAAVYDELNAVTQWAYPNRIFKAAYFVGKAANPRLQMVQLTSFGCGPDAFILDEVSAVLQRYHKNLTVLKIDDVNNIGSLKLRVRSLIESVSIETESREVDPFATTRPFLKSDKQKTLLAPYFAEGYSEFVPSMFKLAGYNLVNLPLCNQTDAEKGLLYANNDVCYPATLVVGSIMQALESGKYDLDNTAVIITQTGGQCRATNYYALIKSAMVKGGFSRVPLLSLAVGSGVQASQPGFDMPYRKIAKMLIHTILYADCLQKLYYSTAPRCSDAQRALSLREQYTRAAFPHIEANNYKALQPLLKQAVEQFVEIVEPRDVPTIGVVGEIYVKYNGFSHKYVAQWLVEQGVEVVPPALVDFFSTSFVMQHRNRSLHISNPSTPAWLTDAFYKYIRSVAKQYDAICAPFAYYRPSVDIFDYNRLSERVLSSAADFGEGWFLSGEICHLAENGIKNVISLQPFGCIANHIISKGVEKRLRQLYPQLNMLFLDFDSSTSDANIYNRLHFMVANAKKMQ